jgi:hypothetical protein
LIQVSAMRFLIGVVAFLAWPFSLWSSRRAQRRLRAYDQPSGSEHLTLRRVA